MNGITHGRDVNAAKLWVGGAATAVVAAMITLVGVLLVRGALKIPILAPQEAGFFGDANTAAYAATAAGAALLATALLHLLLFGAPAPLNFFGWIAVLGTAVAAVLPFTQSAPMPSQAATAGINAVTGLAIISLLGGVGMGSVRRRRGAAALGGRPVRGDGSVPGTGYTAPAPPAERPTLVERPGAPADRATYASGRRDAFGGGPDRGPAARWFRDPADEEPTTHYPKPY